MLDDHSENSDFWSGVPDRRRTHRDHGRDNGRDISRDITRPTVRPTGQPATRAHHGSSSATRTVEHQVVRAHHGRPSRRPNQSMRRAGVLGITVLLLVPVAMALRAEAAAPRTVAPLATSPATTLASVAQADALAAADASVKAEIEALTPIVPEEPDPAPTEAAQRSAAPVKATATTVKPAKAANTTKPVAKKAAAACTKYTIVKGDTWITMAHRAGVTLGAMLRANNARSTTALRPGKQVCLPAGATMPTPTAKSSTKATATTVKASTSGTAHSTAPATTQPQLVPPANTFTRDEVIQIIRDVWPDDLEDHAIAIADRESHLNPTARNFCCYGLFQIYYSVHRTWLASVGVTSAAQLWDPRVSALVAYQMYLRSGFAPWGG